MAFPDKNYTYGRYRIWFDKFAPGTKNLTGQRYFGNTPELGTSSESETLEHLDSDNGIRVKDDSMLLEVNRKGSFTTDHISPQNLALFFLGDASIVTQASAVGLTYTISNVILGCRYQIGQTPSVPAGVRGLTNVVVKVAAVTKALGTDYTLDADTGGVIPLVGGSIIAGDALSVTYDTTATSYNRVVTASTAEIQGAMFLESTSPKGEKMDYYLPFVSIKPSGDFNLKSDEWQTLPFEFDILKLSDTVEAVYINGRPGSGI